MGIATDIILLVVAAFFAGLLMQKLGQPLLLGYIAVGALLGPYSSGFTVSSVEQIELLAEIGVALLLFALGLEFSLTDLRPVRKVALIGTPIQIALTGTLGFAIGSVMGWEWQASVWLGALISLSSTMVLLKTLTNQGRLGALSGKVMIGMLLVQDLAVVPMMVILPQLNELTTGLPALAWAIAKVVAFMGAMALLGTRLLPRVMTFIARLGSRELFLLGITAIGLGIGYVTYLVGLSFAFGAFVAGLVLSESDYGHQALSDIIPLRDIFGLLFFASVGMLLDPGFLLDHLGTIVLLVLVVSIGKGVILASAVRMFGYVNVVPLAVGLGLFQVGEFSFVLGRVGVATNSIDGDVFSLVLTTAVVSMVLTPFVSGQTARLYRLRKRWFQHEPLELVNVPAQGLRQHVVIAGGGRVGLLIARTLTQLGLQFVIVELDARRLEQAKRAGMPAVYGDASHEVVLRAAAVREACLLLVTTPAVAVARAIVIQAKTLNPRVAIVAHSSDAEFIPVFRELEIEEIVLAEFEAGLEMTRQALIHLRIPAPEIQRHTESLRHELFAPIGSAEDYKILGQLRSAERQFDLQWVLVVPTSSLVAKTIGEAAIRTTTGASVVGVIRDGKLEPNPDAEFRFQAGDLTAIIGTDDARQAFQKL